VLSGNQLKAGRVLAYAGGAGLGDRDLPTDTQSHGKLWRSPGAWAQGYASCGAGSLGAHNVMLVPHVLYWRRELADSLSWIDASSCCAHSPVRR
jgi:hypothetical protein